MKQNLSLFASTLSAFKDDYAPFANGNNGNISLQDIAWKTHPYQALVTIQ